MTRFEDGMIDLDERDTRLALTLALALTLTLPLPPSPNPNPTPNQDERLRNLWVPPQYIWTSGEVLRQWVRVKQLGFDQGSD